MSFYESYIGSSSEERQEMLKEIGKTVEDLFNDVPKDIFDNFDMDIPGPYSEFELLKLFGKIAAKNKDPNGMVSFLGGGIRQQYVPAAVAEIMGRGEIYTAYTPYQPEISQGTLQFLYEYQSMIAELLNMDVVNASMYDWATALGEVLLIMNRITRKKKFVIAQPVSPKRLEAARSYLQHSDLSIELVEAKDGNVDMEKLMEIFNEEKTKDKKEKDIAGLYFEVPNYFGSIPSYPQDLVDLVHESKALVCVGVDPISTGLIAAPGDYNADFAIGEGQMLGNAPSAGGPLLGILAMKYNKKWVRAIPGRLVGETTEAKSNVTGYCITLQTREQHIKRDKATSNICSNQSLMATNAAVYLASLGKYGLVELSQQLLNKAHYLASELDKVPKVVAPKYKHPFFAEFVVEFEGIGHNELEQKCIEKGFIPGIPMEGEGCLRLISVSELIEKEEMDSFVNTLKEVLA